MVVLLISIMLMISRFQLLRHFLSRLSSIQLRSISIINRTQAQMLIIAQTVASLPLFTFFHFSLLLLLNYIMSINLIVVVVLFSLLFFVHLSTSECNIRLLILTVELFVVVVVVGVLVE